MDSNKILQAFLELLKNNFSAFPQAMQDLPLLNKSLAELPDDEIEQAVDLIIDWCSERQPLGKIISDSLRQIKLDHPIEPLPDNLDNTFREVRKTVQQKLDALKKAQDEKNG
ncbi:hypothetical protein H6S82_21185 [Planktothrix sp. FACHB-1355]|uniref:Uncharacterized protein n=1 Tax=Aerosakkonema funiforme FACHB-1375 TaxID=2949571 RepID=A0A926VJW7_9CYAN|nr:MULTISPECIES: hypothetical protein [Oscillatoriales]MBD2183809.1 hypothetical protein [Aerosakkonema funiforme FACHB-1375]MBD3561335.1 hypothetical protein [Planktothrix sp. FACHB-1355]